MSRPSRSRSGTSSSQPSPAQLVEDLAGLGVDRRVVLDRLQRGEGAQRSDRQLGPEDERLQRGDQRVTAEHRHEPGHACGRKLANPLDPLQPKRREVCDRALVDVLQFECRRLEPRHPQLPRRQALTHVLQLGAEGLVARERLRRDARAEADVEGQLPPGMRRERDREAGAGRRRARARGRSESSFGSPRRPRSRTSRRRPTSRLGSAGSGAADSGLPNAKSCALTEMMSAKSAASSSSTANDSSDMLSLLSVRCSVTSSRRSAHDRPTPCLRESGVLGRCAGSGSR